MKQMTTILLLASLVIMGSVSAQQSPKPRQSPKASVTQRIGVATDIKIDYSRPGVKGRKIWGELVPYGMAPASKESNNKPYPWRGGANENTTIQFNNSVSIDGHKLPAGKYGVHFIPSEKEWTVIFSKNDSSWGSYRYNQDEDALRITVTPVKAPFEEWLAYGFEDLKPLSAVAFLHWEELKVPFKIETEK